MATYGGGGTIKSHFGPGLKSQPGCNSFFANFCTNSYKNCYTNCILRIRTRCGFCTNSYIFVYELYSTNSYNELRARSAPRWRSPSREGETSCPDQVAPAAPTFRVHPAALTLGYTRLPRPVRVRSWGGWVRNGMRITIQKSGLYDLTRVAYSQPPIFSRLHTKGGRTQREGGQKGREDTKGGRRGRGTMDCPNKGEEIAE
jgi:hypothetical protein